MSYQILFTTKADYDLNKIKIWYDNINPELTTGLFSELSTEFKRIKKSPLIYQDRYRQVRIAFLIQFEYGIHFIVNDNQIIVLRILHNKQYYTQTT